MLIASKNEKRLIAALEKEGIKAAVIGEFTPDGRMLIQKDGHTEKLDPPDRDELYKLKEK